jgi:hypothetical protein
MVSTPPLAPSHLGFCLFASSVHSALRVVNELQVGGGLSDDWEGLKRRGRSCVISPPYSL